MRSLIRFELEFPLYKPSLDMTRSDRLLTENLIVQQSRNNAFKHRCFTIHAYFPNKISQIFESIDENKTNILLNKQTQHQIKYGFPIKITFK